MPQLDTFAMFARALAETGTPEQQTDDYVENVIYRKYESVFEAVGKFDRLLKFQDSKLGLTGEVKGTNRDKFSVVYLITLDHGAGTAPMRTELKESTITTNFPKLVDLSEGGRGLWDIDDIDGFIDSLSKTILHILGAVD